MSEPFELKYLFEAEFIDGIVLYQTPDDKSNLLDGKSQFYDVLNSGRTLRSFSLVGVGNRIKVDLLTGIFEVNGLRVLLEGDKLPGMPDKFELIFYRQRTESMNITYKVKTQQPLNTEMLPSFCEYFIGWQCNIAGKNYQQKLAVS